MRKQVPSGSTTGNSTVPFVCHLAPFVCHKGTFELPFVSFFAPLVVNGKKMRGFTLIEVLTVVVIVGVLMAMGIPSFRGFILDRRIYTEATDLVVDLNVAKSEAIKVGSTSTVPKKNVGVCTGTSAGCNPALAWNQGWVIFVDNNGNGAWDAAIDSVVRVHPALEGGNTLNNVGGVVKSIVFNAYGATMSGIGSYAFCDSRGPTRGRQVTVTTTGQIRSSTPASCS